MPKNLGAKPHNHIRFFAENVQSVGGVVFIPKDEVELVKKEVKENARISK